MLNHDRENTATRQGPCATGPMSAVFFATLIAITAPPLAFSQDGQPVSPSESKVAQTSDKLAEIIVTAEKRAENLQDVPAPVTVISAQSLIDTNELRLQDYYATIPGMTFTPAPGGSMLAIRGLSVSPGFTSPTVGVVIDDVPFGSSTGNGGGFATPDIDPSDLSRIEVLRGPQGTLYGASSIGGLVKYVTIDPSVDGFSGRVQAGTDSVYNGAKLGYNARGAVNVPISETLAVRASGYSLEDPGYIDNPVFALRGVNKTAGEGGRLSALWRPLQEFSVKLSALVEHSDSSGSSYTVTSPTLGALQTNFLPGTGGFDNTVQAYSGTITAKFGGVDLTSLTGFNRYLHTDATDYTSILGSLTENGACFSGPGPSCFAGFGVTGTPLYDRSDTNKFTQEVRLSGAVTENIDWLVGTFYTHEKSDYVQNLMATAPTGVVVGEWLYYETPTTYEEYAGFADLTVHFTDQFNIELGGRESRNQQSFSEFESGPYVTSLIGVSSPLIYPETHSSEDAFTYLVTPQFKVSPDLMIYTRLASGYRPGGPNANALALNTPAQFAPDKTQNYEIGIKGDIFDHRLSYDGSVYYIDWKNVQIQAVIPSTGAGYTTNAGAAKSEGVEFSVQARPISGMTVAAWIAWNEAVLKKGFPATDPTYGTVGDRLPLASRVSGNVSLDQEFPLAARVNGFAGATVSYVGNRVGEFTSTAERQYYPPYARTDARAGVKYDSWKGSFYVNNLTDKRGILQAGLDIAPAGFDFIQPRTVGLNISKTF